MLLYVLQTQTNKRETLSVAGIYLSGLASSGRRISPYTKVPIHRTYYSLFLTHPTKDET